MLLKQYQKQAVDKLLSITCKLLKKEDSRVCIFKAPTGSGKTIVLADWLSQLANEKPGTTYAFIWLSANDLHMQSKVKLDTYLHDSCYQLSEMQDISDACLVGNQVLFLNWHSLTKQDKKTGEWANTFMRDNERDINFPTIIKNTKESGIEIILVIDESHYHYWSDKSQMLVHEIIAPKLVIEVSATPKLCLNNEDISNGDAGYISVKFDDVIAEEMLAKNVLINPEITKASSLQKSSDEAIIDAAIIKQKELFSGYEALKSIVRPLLLIQLPSETKKTSVLDQKKLDQIEEYLYKFHNITVDNKRLAIWTADRKENKDNIEHNQNAVDVLIFKQAIAQGWDCPRAQILVMLRDIKNFIFEIQTVGRILRMPELKHYTNNVLNSAYIYTNLEKIKIADDEASERYFQLYSAKQKKQYENINLPSVHFSRLDHGDLTLAFRRLFIDQASLHFRIDDADSLEVKLNKVSEKIDLEPKNLQRAIIVDVLIESIDNASEIIGDTIHFDSTEYELKQRFEAFAKLASLPYAPIRSYTKIQHAIYDWFDEVLDYGSENRLDIQKLILCSEKNQNIFIDIIDKSKKQFSKLKSFSRVARESF